MCSPHCERLFWSLIVRVPTEETSVGLEEDASAAATSEATQEERMYRAWMNSMDLGDIHVSDVYADAANTVLLLKVIDVVRPDSVDWKRVNTSKLNNVRLPR
jgi:Calponin homology (CH) domain